MTRLHDYIEELTCKFDLKLAYMSDSDPEIQNITNSISNLKMNLNLNETQT